MNATATESDWGNELEQLYVLRLFVAGTSPNSVRAIKNLKSVCETYLADKYELEIIDLHQQAHKAEGEQIIALPMLVKKSPGTERRMIGDMSDTVKVLKGLGIKDSAA